MDASDILSCSSSTFIKKSREGVEPKSEERQVCRIAFEEYLNVWMEIATTNPELLRGRESSDEFIIRTERWTVHYGSTDRLAQSHVMRSLVPKHQKKEAKAKRVERMRRLYTQCKAPELQIPDQQENWEREMDELVEWTHSLSLKELDDRHV